MKKTGQALGFVFETAKRQVDKVIGESLGSKIYGEELEVAPKPKRCAEAMSSACFVMAQKVPTTKQVEILGGLWIYLAQYAPPLMASFGQIWEIILERCTKKKEAKH